MSDNTKKRNDSHLVSGAAGVTTDDQSDADKRRKKGEFVRGVSTARNWVQDDENAQYPVEANRYHLYVAYNCPWCHRVLLGRAIQGLEDVISVDVLFPNRSGDDERLGPNMWKFKPDGQVGQNGKHVKFSRCTQDTVMGKKYVKEIYEVAGIDDQKSVPILFDKKTKTVVNNESAEILRMFGTVFRKLSKHQDVKSLYPDDTSRAIDEVNDWVYKDIANGSYKAGFSSNQEVYETAYETFFVALDKLDSIFASNTFLLGNSVTEADLRLFHKYLWEYRNIWRWMQDMMALPGMESVADAEYLQQCKQGYFGRTGNGTIPVGPLGYPECYKTKHWSHK